MEQAKYIPGSCNIGPQERVLRERFGWIGVVVFLGLLIWFHQAAFPKWVNFFLIIPALMGSVGLLQYYAHFCVNFGLRGLMNVDKEAFKTEPVDRAEFRRLDRQKAWKIISAGFGISLAATLLAYFL
jgi:hypothetical protein